MTAEDVSVLLEGVHKDGLAAEGRDRVLPLSLKASGLECGSVDGAICNLVIVRPTDSETSYIAYKKLRLIALARLLTSSEFNNPFILF